LIRRTQPIPGNVRIGIRSFKCHGRDSHMSQACSDHVRKQRTVQGTPCPSCWALPRHDGARQDCLCDQLERNPASEITDVASATTSLCEFFPALPENAFSTRVARESGAKNVSCAGLTPSQIDPLVTDASSDRVRLTHPPDGGHHAKRRSFRPATPMPSKPRISAAGIGTTERWKLSEPVPAG